MRILKFAGVFLVTLIVVFFIVFGFNLKGLFTLLDNKEGLQEGQEWVAKTSSLEGLTEYIGAQPEHVSIASIAIGYPDSSILYNEHTPRTMGRLSNLFLAIEYLRRMEQDKTDLQNKVDLDEINKFQLPYINSSNHDNALSALAGEDKIAEDGTVALSDVIRIAVEYNDLAASDYLLMSLGRQSMDKLMDELEIAETESILPFSGLYITLHPFLHDRSYRQHADSLSLLSRMEFEDLVWQTTREFAGDPAFREQVKAAFEEHTGLGIQFTRERDLLNFFPKTTAHEMVSLMRRIQQERLISKRVSQHMKEIMGWPLNSKRLSRDLKSYGAIYDNRIGMVNGISFGVSSYSDTPFAQAVFFDNLPVGFWFHMSSNLMHQDYKQQLVWDPALRKATIQQIQKNN